MSPEDREYYRNRAIDERRMAAACETTESAEIHEKLARLYDRLVEFEEHPRSRLTINGQSVR